MQLLCSGVTIFAILLAQLCDLGNAFVQHANVNKINTLLTTPTVPTNENSGAAMLQMRGPGRKRVRQNKPLVPFDETPPTAEDKKRAIDSASAGYIQVLDTEDELNERNKAVTVKSPGGRKESILILAKHNSKVYAFDNSCTRCKFPLIDSKFEEFSGEKDGTTKIRCPFCSQSFEVGTGQPAGSQGGGGGGGGGGFNPLKGAVNKLYSASPSGPLTFYPTKFGTKGGVYVKPLKKN